MIVTSLLIAISPRFRHVIDPRFGQGQRRMVRRSSGHAQRQAQAALDWERLGAWVSRCEVNIHMLQTL